MYVLDMDTKLELGVHHPCICACLIVLQMVSTRLHNMVLDTLIAFVTNRCFPSQATMADLLWFSIVVGRWRVDSRNGLLGNQSSSK